MSVLRGHAKAEGVRMRRMLARETRQIFGARSQQRVVGGQRGRLLGRDPRVIRQIVV